MFFVSQRGVTVLLVGGCLWIIDDTTPFVLFSSVPGALLIDLTILSLSLSLTHTRLHTHTHTHLHTHTHTHKHRLGGSLSFSPQPPVPESDATTVSSHPILASLGSDSPPLFPHDNATCLHGGVLTGLGCVCGRRTAGYRCETLLVRGLCVCVCVVCVFNFFLWGGGREGVNVCLSLMILISFTTNLHSTNKYQRTKQTHNNPNNNTTTTPPPPPPPQQQQQHPPTTTPTTPPPSTPTPRNNRCLRRS